jgi:hypothetical protein
MLYLFSQPAISVLSREPPIMMMIPVAKTSTMACVDPDDFDRVNAHRWRSKRYGPNEIPVTRIDGRYVRMNRFVLGCTPGDGFSVVPENGSYFDCRKDNLEKIASPVDPTKSWDSRRMIRLSDAIASASDCHHPLAIAAPNASGRYTCSRCDATMVLMPLMEEKVSINGTEDTRFLGN